jgi:hypothetical protein
VSRRAHCEALSAAASRTFPHLFPLLVPAFAIPNDNTCRRRKATVNSVGRAQPEPLRAQLSDRDKSAPGVRPLGYLRNRVNVTAEQYNDKEKDCSSHKSESPARQLRRSLTIEPGRATHVLASRSHRVVVLSIA